MVFAKTENLPIRGGMLIKALKDSDRRILSVTAAVMLLLFWALMSLPERPAYLPGKPIGRLDSLGTIKRLNKNKKRWEDVKEPNVYPGDAFASGDRPVRIYFSDGSSADLGANAVMRLGKEKSGPPLITVFQGAVEPIGQVAVRFRGGDFQRGKSAAPMLASPVFIPLPSDFQ